MKTLEEVITDLRKIQATLQMMKSKLEVLEQDVNVVLEELDSYAVKE